MFPFLVGPGMSRERVSQHRNDVGAGDRQSERILLRKGHLGGDRDGRNYPGIGGVSSQVLRASVLPSIDEMAHMGLALRKYEINIVAR